MIPVRLVSEANLVSHWTVKYKRKKKVQLAIKTALKGVERPTPPCKITLTRVAPRALDVDNNWFCLKNTTDFIADWIVPGLQAGRADDPKNGLEFDCKQRKGKVKEYALEIKIVH